MPAERTRLTLPAIVLLVVLGASLAPAARAGADPVTVARSGWFWGNPRPQGEDLASVAFSGATGYAAGAGGALLRSTDSGATWTGLRGGRGVDFRRLATISPGTFVAAGDCALRRSDDGGQTLRVLRWTSNERRCASRIRDIAFPTATVGYLLLEDHSLLRTADGGGTWARVGTPGDSVGLAFRDAQSGLAAGPGGIQQTVDGGATWTQASASGATVVRFASAGVAYASGGQSFLRSGDGGATWAPTAATSYLAYAGNALLACGDATTCLTGLLGGSVQRTADAGATFSAPLSLRASTGLAFASPARAIGVGPAGATAVSQDGGATFAAVGSQLGASYTSVRAASATSALLFGRDSLARTTDGGQTWATLGVPTSATIVDAAFPTSSAGYVLDGTGAVLRTANGGVSWSTLDTGDSAGPAALAAADPDHLVLVGPRGIRRSDDGGAVLVGVGQSTVRRAALAHADRAGSALVAWGPRSMLVSRDRGRTWAAASRPGRDALRWVDFSDSRRGWALDGTGRLWKTTDGGRRWAESTALGSARGSMVSFASAGSGWVLLAPASGDLGSVLRTSDGGASWRVQVVSRQIVSSLAALSASGAVALGAASGQPATFGTADGGDAPSSSSLALAARLPRRGLTRRALRARHGRVVLAGRLRPDRGGETVIVLTRRASGGSWVQRSVSTGDGGRFSLTLRVSRSTVAVARWAGDDYTAAAGSRAATIRVR